jgi:hypothetical protein
MPAPPEAPKLRRSGQLELPPAHPRRPYLRRVCMRGNCPHTTTGDRPVALCPRHEAEANRAKAERDRARGTSTARGYGSAHQRARAQAIAAYLPSDPCARCGRPLGPVPELLDLGHLDSDRSQYSGLEHRACNRGWRRWRER